MQGFDPAIWPNDDGGLGALFAGAPGFSAVLHGPEHRWVFVNRAIERLFPDRTILGATVRDTFPETEARDFLLLLDRVYVTGERYVGERVPLRLDPPGAGAATRELFVDFSYEPIRDDAGLITGIFISGFDVTARVRAEVALREREARYRVLFNSVDEGFCVIEMLFDEAERPLDYRFIETNATFERQAGLAGAQGRTARELVPNLEQHWFDIYGRVALSGSPTRFIDGSAEMGRWFDVYATRIGGAGSREVALLFTDITARRRDEAEREELLAAERAAREAAEDGAGPRHLSLDRGPRTEDPADRVEGRGTTPPATAVARRPRSRTAHQRSRHDSPLDRPPDGADR